MKVFWCGLLAVFITTQPVVRADVFLDKINESERLSTKIMDEIYKMWEVDKYPNFLKSCWMPRHSWDKLTAKFELAVLKAVVDHVHVEFIVSFTGSSVTAGHDSPFKMSFPILLDELLRPVFKPININFVSKNVAMVRFYVLNIFIILFVVFFFYNLLLYREIILACHMMLALRHMLESMLILLFGSSRSIAFWIPGILG